MPRKIWRVLDCPVRIRIIGDWESREQQAVQGTWKMQDFSSWDLSLGLETYRDPSFKVLVLVLVLKLCVSVLVSVLRMTTWQWNYSDCLWCWVMINMTMAVWNNSLGTVIVWIVVIFGSNITVRHGGAYIVVRVMNAFNGNGHFSGFCCSEMLNLIFKKVLHHRLCRRHDVRHVFFILF